MKSAIKNEKKPQKKAGYVYAVRWTLVVSLALAFLTLVVLLVVPSGSHASGNTEIMQKGITIDGIDVSSLTREQAHGTVLEALNSRLSSMAISVSYGKKSYMFTAADIAVSTDINDVMAVAAAYGADEKAVEILPDSVTLTENGAEYHTAFSVNDNALYESMGKISEIFNTSPEEPYAEPDRNASSPAFIYHEGVPGMKLNEDALAQDIKLAINSGELQASVTPQFDSVDPTVSLDDVRANTAQRSVFKTYYDHGSLKAKSRVFNVSKGAGILNGCTVAPGEEFSFNDYIGPRTYDGGWESAPGIVNGNMYEMQAGGGICQVSTTLHNAVMMAGPELEVTVRKNHSWPSSYVDYGLDATVSTGGPDFMFKNNTNAPIYIFAYADSNRYIMTIYIYGEPLPEGISYNVYATTDKVIEPDKTKIIEEPTWPVTKTETTIQSRKGYKTTAYRDTLKDGEVIDTEVLYHYSYRAIRGEKHVGTMPVQTEPDTAPLP